MNTFLEKFKQKIKEIDSPSIIDTQPIPEFKIEERWTVYSFSVPIKYSKKVAFGFESQEEAKRFIKEHLKDKTIESDGITYYLRYDVIFESREEINVFYNDPQITTVGNEPNQVFDEWNRKPRFEIELPPIVDRWVG